MVDAKARNQSKIDQISWAVEALYNLMEKEFTGQIELGMLKGRLTTGKSTKSFKYGTTKPSANTKKIIGDILNRK